MGFLKIFYHSYTDEYKTTEDITPQNVNEPIGCLRVEGRQRIFTSTNMLNDAVKQQRLDAVEFLVLHKKANVSFKVDGDVIILRAISLGNYEMFRVLLERGNPGLVDTFFGREEDPESENLQGRAAKTGQLPILKYLIEEKHSDPTLGNSNARGSTPLMIACIEGHFDIVRYLIHKLGVEIWTPNPYGEAAIDIAKQQHHSAIVRFLEDHIKNENKPRPLDLPLPVKFKNQQNYGKSKACCIS